MKRRNFARRPGCAVEATLDLIDGKWKGVILYHLQSGTQRFGELRRLMPGITQRILTKQLRALEEDKLIIRKVSAEVPPRVEYSLSELGESLRTIIGFRRSVAGAARGSVVQAFAVEGNRKPLGKGGDVAGEPARGAGFFMGLPVPFFVRDAL